MSETLGPTTGDRIDDDVVEMFKEFFAEHSQEDIERFEETYEDTIELDYTDLYVFDADLAETLREAPVRLLRNAEEALRDYDEAIDGLDDAVVRLINVSDPVPIREIRAKHIGDLVAIEGIVSKATDVQPKINQAAYRCLNCGNLTYVPQPLRDDDVEPEVCSGPDCDNSSGFIREISQSEVINYQKVQVEEAPEELPGGENPQSIDITIRGDITGTVTPGERVSVMGILRAKEKDGSSVLDTYIEGNNIQQEEADFEDITTTVAEEKRIKELSQDPDIFDRLVDSLAPTIYGWEVQKRAAVLQLFGGVRKKLPGGSKIRGDLHVLYVGDPGTGKSQILQYVDRLSPRGVYTSGKGSSSAGLTAAAVRDSEFGGDDKWTLEAGAMVIADKGIACIDELDKMDSSDRSALHEALEQQTVSVSKAGINATLKSRCSMLAAANPTEGRWQEYESIPSQIDIEPALVSRFDLIFTMDDKPDEDHDSTLASHILQSNRVGQKHTAGIDIEEGGEDDVTADIEPDIFRKYVAYSRKNCHPVLSEEAEQKLNEFYVDMRNNLEGEEGADAIPVTARKLEALVRLAEASARIRLSDEITERDAEYVIELTRESMRQVGFDEEEGVFDVDMIEAGQSQSQRDLVRDLKTVIKGLCDEAHENDEKPQAHIDDILGIMTDKGFEADRVKHEISKLCQKAELYEPETDYYAPV